MSEGGSSGAKPTWLRKSRGDLSPKTRQVMGQWKVVIPPVPSLLLHWQNLSGNASVSTVGMGSARKCLTVKKVLCHSTVGSEGEVQL